MPSAEKRGGKLTGFWYGEVRLTKTNERFRERFETRKEAKGYEDYIKATGVAPANAKTAKLAGPTLKETVILMRATRKSGRDPSGARRLDLIVDRMGHLTLQAIGTTELDKLVAWLEKRPANFEAGTYLTDGTINRYLSALSSVFTWARQRDHTIPQPVFPWRKEEGHRIHWFSQAQEEVLVAWLERQAWLSEALSLRVLCATGMRWGEFAGLEMHQCQPEWINLDKTKTDTPRDIPIDEDLMRGLKAMISTNTIPKYRHMRTRLKEAVKACGYSDKLGIHNARHGTATQLIKDGAPLPVVQKLLGHKNIKTTMKYLHVESDDLQKAMRNLRPRRGEKSQIEPLGHVFPLRKSEG